MSDMLIGILLGSSAAAILFLLFFGKKIARHASYVIPYSDVRNMVSKVNPRYEVGGTIDAKPMTEYAEVQFSAIGRETNGIPSVDVDQKSNQESVWHTHPYYGIEYVDTRNSVPSPEDVAILTKSGNVTDILITPYKKVREYRITPVTKSRMSIVQRLDPIGIALASSLRKDMKKIARNKPKTVEGANQINREWEQHLYNKYGIIVRTLPIRKNGVRVNNIKIKEK